MGVPSGNFSSASSGRLQVVFSGEITHSAGGTPGWASGGSPDLLIRCTVGSGETLQETYLRLYAAGSAILERDYVGGSGNVPMAMEVVVAQLASSGPSTLQAKNLRITCRLYGT